MFEAQLQTDPVEQFITLLTAVDEEEEAVVTVTEAGFQSQIVDPANVALVDTGIPAAAFETLDIESDRQIGLNLERVEDVVGTADSGDAFEMEFDPETRTLLMVVDGLEYTMGLIDPDSIRAAPDIPDLDFVAEVSVPTDVLQRGVDAADMVGETMDYGITDGEFVMEASGDLDDVEYTPEEAVVTPASGDSVADVSSTFSLGYIESLVKAIPADEVTLYVADEKPITVEFEHEVATVDESDETVTASSELMVAPRVASD